MATENYPRLRNAYLRAEKRMLDDLAKTDGTTPPDPIPPVPDTDVFPNAPGWPLVLDAPNNDLSEWDDILWDYGNPPYCSLVTDETAPTSPSSVMQIKYPKGFACGAAPASPYLGFPTQLKQVYVGATFRHNPDWVAHQGSAVSKLIFFFHPSLGSVYLCMYGKANPYELRMYCQLQPGPGHPPSPIVQPPPNDQGWLVPLVNAPKVTTGQWFTVEVLIDVTCHPSVTQWWQDGVAMGLYHGVYYPSDGFSEFKISPTYGGTEPPSTKPHDDFLWCDHVRIEGR